MNYLQPLIWFLPAYVANASATFSKLLEKRHPVDFGIVCKDGKRLLGDGKTWEGLIMGILAGSLTGVIINHFLGFGTLYDYFFLSIGALLGDMIGSFIKRRVGLPRGAEAPLMDQLDFVMGAFLLYPPPPDYGTVIVAVTPILHKAANVLGHRIGVKHEPW